MGCSSGVSGCVCGSVAGAGAWVAAGAGAWVAAGAGAWVAGAWVVRTVLPPEGAAFAAWVVAAGDAPVVSDAAVSDVSCEAVVSVMNAVSWAMVSDVTSVSVVSFVSDSDAIVVVSGFLLSSVTFLPQPASPMHSNPASNTARYVLFMSILSHSYVLSGTHPAWYLLLYHTSI